MEGQEPKGQQSDLDSEISSEINFIQEKIKERPVNRKKLLRRTIITVAMAMVFGLVACVTFLLLEPVINRMLYPEEPAEIVRFPEEEQEVNPEDMAADEAELQIIREEEEAGSQADNTPEQGADGVSQDGAEGAPSGDHDRNQPEGGGLESGSAPEGNHDGTPQGDGGDRDGNGTSSDQEEEELSPEEMAKLAAFDNYQALYGALGDLRTEVEKSIVSVTSVSSDVNWINDTLENTGVESGLIVADNGRELLILVGYENLKEADSISVLFGEEQKEASLKEVDLTTNLAVIAVPLSELSAKQKEEITYASLGSSLGRGLVGQPVMAVGAPMGGSGSVCHGMVTSQGTALGLLDSNYKVITTDVYGSKSSNGVLVNMRGEIVGVLYNGYENSDMPNRLCGIGISELKRTIEKLSNGEKMVYLGTHGADISAVTYQEYELPRGAYMTNIDMDSPAMQAGLQNGDIITKVGDTDITSYTEFVNILMKSQVGQNLRLTVVRQSQGRGEYQEMNVTVTLQEQK